MPNETQCARCDTRFTQPGGRGRPRKFCSDECSQRAARYTPAVPVLASCEACAGEMLKSHGRRFCDDDECRRARERERDRKRVRDWAAKDKKATCIGCGELTWGKPSQVVKCHKCRRGDGPPVADLEWLREQLEQDPAPNPGTTKAKGLGWRHEQAVHSLRHALEEGSPCEWCGRPMWLDPTQNWDYDPRSARNGNGALQGDHLVPRSHYIAEGLPVPLPDRLLHGACNQQRGKGTNDHLAWASG